LFLDEPTTGVDVVSRREFWDMLKNLKQQGITILVSTPYMDEATLCDRIALIQTGKILSIDTPENIVKQYPETLYAIKAANMNQLLQELRSNPLIKSCYAFGEYLHVSLQEQINDDQLLKGLSTTVHAGVELKQIEPTIEDCFINLMK
jgi:ABC-type multidrug transport system ATPase subunit